MDYLRYFRNAIAHSSPGPYLTQLSPEDESAFQAWVRENRIPFDPSPQADYDMRGFYAAQRRFDPDAVTQVSMFDHHPHFTDTYKTPFHNTFSQYSGLATFGAPHWANVAPEDRDHAAYPNWRMFDDKNNIVADEEPLGDRAWQRDVPFGGGFAGGSGSWEMR